MVKVLSLTGEKRVASGASVPGERPRWRRRPAALVVAVLVVLLGGLSGVWAWSSSASTVPAVAVRATVWRGEVLERSDLVVARVAPDPGVSFVAADALDGLVGRRAGVDLAAGSLVTANSVTDAAVPPRGFAVVGLSLEAGLAPRTPLRPGDPVRVIARATPTEGKAPSAASFAVSGTVVEASVSEAGGMLVDVQVASADAVRVASSATEGRVALVLDSRQR